MSEERDTGHAFTDHERAVLISIVDRIVPDDDGTPGAVAADAHRYIERELDGAYAHHFERYRSGLLALDAWSQKQHAATFDSLTTTVQDDLLSQLDRGDTPWFGPEGAVFFALVRRHVMEGLFSDPSWGGNKDRIGWELIGYSGPRLVWSADDQRIVEIGPRHGSTKTAGDR